MSRVDTRSFPVSRARRLLDVLVATVGLLVAAPLVLCCAGLLLLAQGRPVFFRQVRVGEGGQPFVLLKLRTMRGGPGAAVTGVGDPRVTRLGGVLRRTSLDELPQLWHVLRGQMTLVGPRPESLELARRYPSECRFVLAARPGLTGPTQLRFPERSATPPAGEDPDEWYLAELVPRRVVEDLTYLSAPSLSATCRHLALTALYVCGLHHPEPRATLDQAPK